MEDKIQVNNVKYLQVFLISFGILGFQLISSLPELLQLDSRAISIPYRIFYAFICVSTLSVVKWGNKINIGFLPILAFIFLYFLRSVYESITRYDIVKTYLIDFWLFAYLIGFLPMFPLLLRLDAITLLRTKVIVFVIAIIINILGFNNNFGSLNAENLGRRFEANGVLNQISYGQTGVVLVIICLSYFHNKKIITKLALIPLISLGLLNVALAGSRGPMIELFIVTFFFFTVNFKKVGVANVAFFILFLIGMGYWFSDYLVFFNTVFDRLQETSFINSNGSEERNYLFKEALDKFYENPILGYQQIGVYPHNLILEAFLALGIFGGLLMIYIFIIALRNCLNLAKINSTNWVALIFLMHIVSAFVSGAIYNSFEFWSLLALSFSLFYNKNLYLDHIV